MTPPPILGDADGSNRTLMFRLKFWICGAPMNFNLFSRSTGKEFALKIIDKVKCAGKVNLVLQGRHC